MCPEGSPHVMEKLRMDPIVPGPHQMTEEKTLARKGSQEADLRRHWEGRKECLGAGPLHQKVAHRALHRA